MRAEKMVKVRMAGFLLELLELEVAAEGVTAAEIVRRAVVLYFGGRPVISNVEESQKWPCQGPSEALSEPAAAPPSSSPPSSPPAPPLTPPSLSPPAQLARSSRRAAPAGPARPARPAKTRSGALFPDAPPPGPPKLSGPPAPPAPPTPPDTPPPLLLFPCVADRQTGEAAPQWPLTAPLVAQWEETFPDMDILGEARKAREWLLANHRKTYGGMRKFLVRWFCTAQNSGRFMRRAGPRRSAAGPQARSLEDVYGFASWEEWQETLRQYCDAGELAGELAKLAMIRAEWEARHG
jgi:hypothetical protein